MIWLFVAALAMLVFICMGQAVTIVSLRLRVAESEEMVGELMDMTHGVHDTRRSYMSGRVRMYAARWGKVIKEVK